MAWEEYHMIRQTGAVEKAWGTEVVWTSTEEYCSKLLMFKDGGCKTPVHFNKKRHKTWFVNEGTFLIRWVETETGQAKETVVKQGEVVEVLPWKPYQLEALLPNSIIFEAGTAEEEGDVCLLSPEENVSGA